MNNKYILIRHGQTYFNKNKVMHGQIDIPLNLTGQNQAKSLAPYIENFVIDLCFCSPLERASQTARILLRNKKHVPITLDSRLLELNKGVFEKTFSKCEKNIKYDQFLIDSWGVEKKQCFFNRVCNFLKEVESKFKNKKILIVAHSGTIKMVMFFFNGFKKNLFEDYSSLRIPNCSPIFLNFKKEVV